MRNEIQGSKDNGTPDFNERLLTRMYGSVRGEDFLKLFSFTP